MRFSKEAFNRHLTNIGQQVDWLASYSCPCTNPTSGAPEPKCPLCVGRGRIWDKPVPTVIGVASQDTQIKWAKLGLFEVGDMVVSIPENSPMWDRAGQFDRVITKNGTDGFSVVLTRGAPTEKLMLPIVQITRCFWRHPQNPAQIVEGGIPVVGADGRLSWTSGEPPAGTRYSLAGERYSEYFMVDQYPSDRNQHSGMRLPKRVVLRKWDLFGRSARTAV